MPTCPVASLVVAGMRYNYIMNLSACILLLQLDVNNSDTAVVINTSAAQLSGVRIMDMYCVRRFVRTCAHAWVDTSA